jgi:dTDP-4-dehydrorhamnose reductase
MQTVAVSGSNGLLGRKLVRAAEARYRVLAMDVAEEPPVRSGRVEYVRCDVMDADLVARTLGTARPAWVFHTAAFTDVDACESHRETAWSVNVVGAENVALACAGLGARMVHLSTDYVFDGAHGPYTEIDTPNPISHYGATKLESERAVASVLPGALIVRTMVLYGFEPAVRPNFVTWLVAKLRRSEPVRIVTDQFGNPTLADDLAAALLVLSDRGAEGIFHAAGAEWLSRHAFALRVAEVFGLDCSLIAPTTSDAFRQPAPRPLRSGLYTEKIKTAYGLVLSPVSTGLEHVKHQMEAAEGNL